MLATLTLAGCVGISPGAAPSGGGPAAPTGAPVIASGPPVTQASQLPTSAPVGVSSAPAEQSAATTSGGPGSIVFVRAGDIWLTAPDGSAVRQVTHDGSQMGYHDPSQAPDGTIYALRGPSTLVALDRTTGAQRATAALPALENGAEQLNVSPDGAHISYVTTGFGQTVDPRFGTPNGAFIYGGSDVATLDGKSVPDAAMPEMIYPTWLDSATVVVSDGTKLYVFPVADSGSTLLDRSDGCLTDFDCPSGAYAATSLTEPLVGASGSLIAYESRPYYGPGGRVIAPLAGGRVQADDACTMPGQDYYSDPGSFAPDGSGFAYDDTTFDPNTLESTVGQGIYTVHLDLGAADCGAAQAKLVLPGGAQPEWGPLAP